MNITFYKVLIAGCDFILVNRLAAEKREKAPDPDFVVSLCNRKTGVGAEGLIILSPSTEYRLRIDFYSAYDGKQGINAAGLLCAARFAFDFGLFQKDTLRVETCSGSFSINSIGSTLFQLDIGFPLDRSGNKIEEDNQLQVEIWKPVQGNSIVYTTLSFSLFRERTVSVTIGEMDEVTHYLFYKRLETEKLASAACFVTAGASDTIEYSTGSELSSNDCIIEASAALIAAACNGTAIREVTARNRTDFHQDDIYLTWSGDGKISAGGIPRYVYTGEYVQEEV
jgi:diaminopimelate epimerase